MNARKTGVSYPGYVVYNIYAIIKLKGACKIKIKFAALINYIIYVIVLGELCVIYDRIMNVSKAPTVQSERSTLQSVRARTAESRHDKSKAQSVIYEDRELHQATPEAMAILELEKGSSWRIVIPEILLGNRENFIFKCHHHISYRMHLVECSPSISIHCASLVYS